jgi:hypothetical protein
MKMQDIADLFLWREGLSDIWPAARKQKNDDFVFHCHETHLLDTEISRASNRAAVASDNSGSDRLIGGLANTAAKREQIFIQAGNDLARAGEFSAACECFIAAEQWLKALALAPTVSIEFWKKTIARYREHLGDLSQTELEEVAPLVAASGDFTSLARAYLTKGLHHKALVAMLAGNPESAVKKDFVDKVVAKYLETSEIVKAAACLVSFDGRENDALKILRASGEHTIANVLEKLLS